MSSRWPSETKVQSEPGKWGGQIAKNDNFSDTFHSLLFWATSLCPLHACAASFAAKSENEIHRAKTGRKTGSGREKWSVSRTCRQKLGGEQ